MDYKTGRPSKAGGRGLRLLCWGRRWAHFTCAKILIFSAMPQAEWKGLWLGVAPRPRTYFSCCVLVLKEMNHVNANQIFPWKGFGASANPYRYSSYGKPREGIGYENLCGGGVEWEWRVCPMAVGLNQGQGYKFTPSVPAINTIRYLFNWSKIDLGKTHYIIMSYVIFPLHLCCEILVNLWCFVSLLPLKIHHLCHRQRKEFRL